MNTINLEPWLTFVESYPIACTFITLFIVALFVAGLTFVIGWIFPPKDK